MQLFFDSPMYEKIFALNIVHTAMNILYFYLCSCILLQHRTVFQWKYIVQNERALRHVQFYLPPRTRIKFSFTQIHHCLIVI